MKHIKKVRWVATSGGFDPLHVGHLRLFKEARKLGDKLVVIVNNDNWLRAKKGFVFMPQKERAELIGAYPFVDKVVFTDHRRSDPDPSVAATLRKLKPAIFAKGGDRTRTNTPETSVCKELGIVAKYNVGGGKVQSSSWMIARSSRPVMRSVRPWGEFYGWDSGKKWYVKTMYVKPKKRLSLQYHKHRSERWVLVEGDATAITIENGEKKKTPLKIGDTFIVYTGMPHRLISKRGGILVEVAVGSTFNENDIVRLEDDHGRATR